jgi:xanthine dehydrogenase YagR molybdenum-binding subunit
MSIGQPLSRIEGRNKVTGRARYSGDVIVPGMLHAVIVGAPVASGRVTSIDTKAALSHPGVVRVLTRVVMPKFGSIAPPAAVRTTTSQGGSFQNASMANAMSASAKSSGRRIALVKTGS